MNLFEALEQHLGKSIVGMTPAKIFDLVSSSAQSGYDALVFSVCIQLEIYKNESAALALIQARNAYDEKRPVLKRGFFTAFAQVAFGGEGYKKVFRDESVTYAKTLAMVESSAGGKTLEEDLAVGVEADLNDIEDILSEIGLYLESNGGKGCPGLKALKSPELLYGFMKEIAAKAAPTRRNAIMDLVTHCVNPSPNMDIILQKLALAKAAHQDLSGSSKFVDRADRLQQRLTRSNQSRKSLGPMVRYEDEIDLEEMVGSNSNDAETDSVGIWSPDMAREKKITVVKRLAGELRTVKQELNFHRQAASARGSLPLPVEQIAIAHREDPAIQAKLEAAEKARIVAEERNAFLESEVQRLTDELTRIVAQETTHSSSFGLAPPPPPPPPPFGGMAPPPPPPPPPPFLGTMKGNTGVGMSLAEQLAGKKLNAVSLEEREKELDPLAEAFDAIRSGNFKLKSRRHSASGDDRKPKDKKGGLDIDAIMAQGKKIKGHGSGKTIEEVLAEEKLAKKQAEEDKIKAERELMFKAKKRVTHAESVKQPMEGESQPSVQSDQNLTDRFAAIEARMAEREREKQKERTTAVSFSLPGERAESIEEKLARTKASAQQSTGDGVPGKDRAGGIEALMAERKKKQEESSTVVGFSLPGERAESIEEKLARTKALAQQLTFEGVPGKDRSAAIEAVMAARQKQQEQGQDSKGFELKKVNRAQLAEEMMAARKKTLAEAPTANFGTVGLKSVAPAVPKRLTVATVQTVHVLSSSKVHGPHLEERVIPQPMKTGTILLNMNNRRLSSGSTVHLDPAASSRDLVA